jgi:hypothetical protein
VGIEEERIRSQRSEVLDQEAESGKAETRKAESGKQ